MSAILRATKAAAARRTERAVLSVVGGIDWLLTERGSVVEPEPYDVVLQRDKLVLRSYRPEPPDELVLGRRVVPAAPPPPGLPVLLIPPLMIKPLVYDLRRDHSFVGTLRAAGLHPFVVDFGDPGAGDETVRLDDYVLDWIPAAIERMLEVSGQDRYAMVGYCMGGLFALMAQGAHQDPRCKAIVTIGSPIDSRKLGLLSVAARLAPVDLVLRRVGNIPGAVSSRAFKAFMPLRTATRYVDLLMNLWDAEWVAGFDSLEAWTGGFVSYPRDAFKQFTQEFMAENQLLQGRMRFGDKVADLSAVHCPVLAFAGDSDQIVPVRAARATLGALGSSDVRFRVVPGGHMGVVAGFRAPQRVWSPTVEFLKEAARA